MDTSNFWCLPVPLQPDFGYYDDSVTLQDWVLGVFLSTYRPIQTPV